MYFLLVNNARKTVVAQNQLLTRRFLPEHQIQSFSTDPLAICSNSQSLHQTKQTHAFALLNGILPRSVSLSASLILRYAEFEQPTLSLLVFHQTVPYSHTAFLWNTLIRALSIARFYDGFVTYNTMLRSGVRPDDHTFPFVLKTCADNMQLQKGMEIHGCLFKLGFDKDVFVGNTLSLFYGNCGRLENVRRVFDEMPERDVVSWNTLIGIFSVRHNKDALDTFRLMIDAGLRPNSIAISSMLPVLVELQLFSLGKEIHGFSLRTGVESDIFVANSLIDMYAKSGHPTEAFYVFNNMESRNVVSWNAMVANFTQNMLEFSALELVRDMQAHNEIPNSVTLTNVLPACARAGFFRPGKEIHARTIRMGFNFDLFVTNALTDMYAKCGCLNLAQNVFDISLRDEISYNILILGYSETSNCSESLRLFLEMRLAGMEHDVVSFMGAISACTNIAATKQGKEIHALLVRRNLHTHLFIANSLLDFYSRCGRIDLANKIFDRIPNRDAASWNTLILGYGMLSEIDIAINLFEAMKQDGVDYDSVSYIAVLSACSHGGLIEKGREYFEEMKARNIEPTQMHYACMVDLLGRAGLMEDACMEDWYATTIEDYSAIDFVNAKEYAIASFTQNQLQLVSHVPPINGALVDLNNSIL
ncbi:hypothetical protein QYF36_006304 [Acer negundo]|nr:hypothetical protein QYF36_006304 [Acer negundo]